MNDHCLFISGWAGYPELFPHLAGECEFLLPFVHHSEREIFERLDAGGGRLVAWSVGAHMVFKRWPRVISNFDQIILIAPFLAYTDYSSQENVREMMCSMRRDAQQTVQLFHRKCGFPGVVTVSDNDADGLLAGLEYLLVSRAMPSHAGAEKLTLIHGEHDRIVAPLASEDIWENMPKATYSAVAYGHWVPESEFV